MALLTGLLLEGVLGAQNLPMEIGRRARPAVWLLANLTAFWKFPWEMKPGLEMLLVDLLFFFAWSRIAPRVMSRELGSLDWGASFTILASWIAINGGVYVLYLLFWSMLTAITAPLTRLFS